MTVRRLTLGALETNCYIVWDEDSRETLVIDPADESEVILSLLEQEDLHTIAVVLTHVHFDHMLAAQTVCNATGAPLYVGAGDEDALSDPMRNLSGWFTPSNPVSISADRLLREGDVLTIGLDHFTVWETPGHTPGCICLVGEDTLFSGDTLFCGSIGRTDFPGSDISAMRMSLRRLARLSEGMTVCSGHGGETTIGWELDTNPYLH